MNPEDASHGTPFRPRITNNATIGRITNTDGSSLGVSQRNTAPSVMRASPYSPFPFGLPIQSSSRSILSPGSADQKILENEEVTAGDSFPIINNHAGLHGLRGRVRAQDVYGGPLMFGGTRAYSSPRGAIPSSGKTRNQRLLLSASPYHCAAASRIAGKQLGRQRPSNSSSTTPSPSGSSTTSSVPGGLSNNASQTTHGVGPSRPSNTSPAHFLQQSPHHMVDPNSSNSSCYSRPSSSLASTSAKSANVNPTDPGCISSTARLILDTLDKMSTPLRDAQKLSSVLSNNTMQHHESPGQNHSRSSRAERRKLIAEALDASSVSMNLSNSSLSMQDDLISNNHEKSGRAKRRRPNLGAPPSGNGSTAIIRANHSYFNGPPLRSLAFSPVSKDKSAAQAALKSARIQNLAETSSNHSSSPIRFSANNNANDTKKASQSTGLEKRIDTKSSGINELKPFPAQSSTSTLLPYSNKQEQNFTSSFSNNKSNISDTVSITSVPSIASKQGGKMKTKISSGLEQVRAQRFVTNSKNELSLESSSDGSELQNTKSLSMFLKSGASDTEKSLKLPNINFTASSNVSSSAAGKDSDASLFSNPIGTKSSKQPIEDKNNSSNNPGAYQPFKETSSPLSFSTGSLPKKIVPASGKDLSSSDINLTTSKPIMSTESPNSSIASLSGKHFAFTSPSNLIQSTTVIVNDNTNTSIKKFTFTSPAIFEKESLANIKTTNANQDKLQSNWSSSTLVSFGQDGPLPDLTKNVYSNINNPKNPTFKSNGCSPSATTLPPHDNSNKYPSMLGSTKLNSPNVKPSVISTPVFGTEIGGRPPFSSNMFSAGTLAGNPGQSQQKQLANNFNMTTTSKTKSPTSNNLNVLPGGIPKVGQLLSGSVMDILKGKSPQQTSPMRQPESQPWDKKFKQNEKPWNLS